jgi:uncharacterized protein (DUF58 family)
MFKRWRKHFVRENRIYIMPSGRGLLFLAAVVVMILTAATYNNNLVFILGFFLFAVFVTSMVQTHYALKGVRLEFIGAEDGFEGDRLGLLFQLTQKKARWRRGLIVRTSSKKFTTLNTKPERMSPTELTHPVRVEVSAWRRGVHNLSEVFLETYYPLGLFRAWKIFRPKGLMFVYARPEGSLKLSSSNFEYGDQDLGLRSSPEGDFGELKEYQNGESYHQIAWKHYARTGQLYTKIHWGHEHKHYEIPWNPSGRNLETYLRQMSRWIEDAVEEGASFEIQTPDQKIESGHGLDHRRLCQRALAAVRAGA